MRKEFCTLNKDKKAISSKFNYDNVYTKKPKFERKLIEKYFTAWCNVNTRLMSTIPDILKMKGSNVKFKGKKKPVQSLHNREKEELSSHKDENISKSSFEESIENESVQQGSKTSVSSLCPQENSSMSDMLWCFRNGVKKLKREKSSSHSNPVKKLTKKNKLSHKIESISTKKLHSEHKENDTINQNCNNSENIPQASSVVNELKSCEVTDTEIESKVQANKSNMPSYPLQNDESNEFCITKSNDDKSTSKPTLESRRYKLISNDFYNYLQNHSEQSTNVPSTKKRKKKTSKKSLSKKAKFQSDNFNFHPDPYTDNWTQLNETDSPNNDENICMIAYLGVGRPLFPLVHRNIVTLCSRQDTKITSLWAEFSLSTLITKPTDCQVKPIILPVKDPKLLSVVSEFNSKWPATFQDIELLRKERSLPITPVTRSQYHEPLKFSPINKNSSVTLKKQHKRKKKRIQILGEKRKCLRSHVRTTQQFDDVELCTNNMGKMNQLSENCDGEKTLVSDFKFQETCVDTVLNNNVDQPPNCVESCMPTDLYETTHKPTDHKDNKIVVCSGNNEQTSLVSVQSRDQREPYDLKKPCMSFNLNNENNCEATDNQKNVLKLSSINSKQTKVGLIIKRKRKSRQFNNKKHCIPTSFGVNERVPICVVNENTSTISTQNNGQIKLEKNSQEPAEHNNKLNSVLNISDEKICSGTLQGNDSYEELQNIKSSITADFNSEISVLADHNDNQIHVSDTDSKTIRFNNNLDRKLSTLKSPSMSADFINENIHQSCVLDKNAKIDLLSISNGNSNKEFDKAIPSISVNLNVENSYTLVDHNDGLNATIDTNNKMSSTVDVPNISLDQQLSNVTDADINCTIPDIHSNKQSSAPISSNERTCTDIVCNDAFEQQFVTFPASENTDAPAVHKQNPVLAITDEISCSTEESLNQELVGIKLCESTDTSNKSDNNEHRIESITTGDEKTGAVSVCNNGAITQVSSVKSILPADSSVKRIQASNEFNNKQIVKSMIINEKLPQHDNVEHLSDIKELQFQDNVNKKQSPKSEKMCAITIQNVGLSQQIDGIKPLIHSDMNIEKIQLPSDCDDERIIANNEKTCTITGQHDERHQQLHSTEFCKLINDNLKNILIQKENKKQIPVIFTEHDNVCNQHNDEKIRLSTISDDETCQLVTAQNNTDGHKPDSVTTFLFTNLNIENIIIEDSSAAKIDMSVENHEKVALQTQFLNEQPHSFDDESTNILTESASLDEETCVNTTENDEKKLTTPKCYQQTSALINEKIYIHTSITDSGCSNETSSITESDDDICKRNGYQQCYVIVPRLEDLYIHSSSPVFEKVNKPLKKESPHCKNIKESTQVFEKVNKPLKKESRHCKNIKESTYVVQEEVKEVNSHAFSLEVKSPELTSQKSLSPNVNQNQTAKVVNFIKFTPFSSKENQSCKTASLKVTVPQETQFTNIVTSSPKKNHTPLPENQLTNIFSTSTSISTTASSKLFSALTTSKINSSTVSPKCMFNPTLPKVISSPAPAVQFEEVDELWEDHFFGEDHSSRTYGSMIDYRLRNRSSVYFYKMRRMLNFQKKNNKHFQSCRYHRVQYSQELEMYSNVEVVSYDTNFKHFEEEDNKDDGNFEEASMCTIFKLKMSEEKQELRKYFSSNPLDVLQAPDKSVLIGLVLLEDCDSNKNKYSINFVDSYLLKEKVNYKWSLLQLDQYVTSVIYSGQYTLSAKLLFEVMYRADLTKKVVCHTIDESAVSDQIKFGVYGIPGLCNAVIVGPYDPREKSHSLEATVKVDASSDNVKIRTCAEMSAFWWKPRLPIRNSYGLSDVNTAHLNFLFSHRNYAKSVCSKQEIKLNELLRKHCATKYSMFEDLEFQTNYVLLHEKDDKKLEMKYNYIRIHTKKSSQSANISKGMEYKYMPLTDFLPNFEDFEKEAPTQLCEDINQDNPNNSRFHRISPFKITSCDAESSSRFNSNATISEKIRRKKLALYRNNLRSSISETDSRIDCNNKDTSLVSILTKAKTIINSLTEDNFRLLKEEESLKRIRKKLIYKFALLLRSIDPGNPAYNVGKQFLSQLYLPKHAKSVISQYNDNVKKSSTSDEWRGCERVKDVEVCQNTSIAKGHSVGRGKIISAKYSEPVKQMNIKGKQVGRRRRGVGRTTAIEFPKTDAFENGYDSMLNDISVNDSEGCRTLESIVTEPPYLEHSYSRMNLDPLSERTDQIELSTSEQLFSSARNFDLINVLNNSTKSAVSDTSNQVSVLLAENEKSISEIIVNKLKAVTDKKDLPPAERRRQIVALIRRILQKMETKYQNKDLRKLNEKRTLVSRLQLLQRMLLGTHINRRFSKTKMIGEIEVRDVEGDITIPSYNRRYNYGVPKSPSNNALLQEQNVEEIDFEENEKCALNIHENGHTAFEHEEVSYHSIENIIMSPDVETDHWKPKKPNLRSNTCAVEESPFIENELHVNYSSEMNDFSSGDLIQKEADTMSKNRNKIILSRKNNLTFNSSNTFRTYSVLKKSNGNKKVFVPSKSKFVPLIIKRPFRDYSTSNFKIPSTNLPDKNVFVVPRASAVPKFQSPEKRIRCPSFIPELKTVNSISSSPRVANKETYSENSLIPSQEGIIHSNNSIIEAFNDSEDNTECILPNEPVSLEDSAVFIAAPPEDNPLHILPDDGDFVENCNETAEIITSEEENISTTAGDERSTCKHGINELANESDVPLRLSVKSFASINSFHSQIMMNVDKLLKF